MKKIMIISSTKTGYGHQSIANALKEQLTQYQDVTVDIVDGFLFAGRLGVKASGIYGPITRWGEQLWKLNWDITVKNTEPSIQMISMFTHDRFMQRLKNDPPNLIISVHPFFNTSMINILRDHNIKIPYITLLADLVDIHPIWVDKRADCILCPTDESMNACLSFGTDRSILRRCGFPIRRIFTEAARQTEHKLYNGERSLECLLMSGGEGSGNLKVIANLLLKNFNANVTVICGRNLRMKAMLEKQLSRYGNRICILGFCTNMHNYMMKADVTIMRGSPNSMLEAVTCNTPLIITGSLPGQEASNLEYAEKYGLAATCSNLKQLVPLMKTLLDNNAAGLNEIIKKQKAYRSFDSASEIAKFLIDHVLETPPNIPDFEYRYPLYMQAVELYRKLETSTSRKRKRH